MHHRFSTHSQRNASHFATNCFECCSFGCDRFDGLVSFCTLIVVSATKLNPNCTFYVSVFDTLSIISFITVTVHEKRNYAYILLENSGQMGFNKCSIV